MAFSEETLVVPATHRDSVTEADHRVDIDSLSANVAFDDTRIEAIRNEDEHEAVLAKIQEIVGDDDYAIEAADGSGRAPTLGDITVLTRTRD